MRGEGVANDLKYFSALNDLPCLVSVPFEECFALILVTHHGQKLPSIAQLIECYAVIPLQAFLTAAYHLLYHIQVKGQRPREMEEVAKSSPEVRNVSGNILITAGSLHRTIRASPPSIYLSPRDLQV